MLKVGDEIRLTDKSWAFGIEYGKFSELYSHDEKEIFIVVKTGLKTLGNTVLQAESESWDMIADILITNGHSGFWFVPSRFAVLIPLLHKIVIGDKTIEISDESYQALKKQLIG